MFSVFRRAAFKIFKGRGAPLAKLVGRVSPSAAGVVVSTLAPIRSEGLVPIFPAVVGSATAPRRRILCREHSLRRRMVLAKIFAENRYLAVLDPELRHDASVHVPSPAGRFVVNARHKGNEKTRVARAWERVSGVPLEVDPTRYEGPMVEKSDANATHDGRVVQGPIGPEAVAARKVYQRLIDNTDGDEVIDLRVPLLDGSIPLLYVKRRALACRFSNQNASVVIREPDEVFSIDEQSRLARFADAMGLDFCEVDVLRDNASGMIWAVDITNGPAGPRPGPPNGLPKDEARRAVVRLARTFDEMIERVAT